MASKSAAISVNVIADAAKFKAGLKEAEAAAGSFDNQMKNLAKGVAGALGTAAVINFGKAAVSAAMDDAAAQAELARQVTASTGATAAQIAAIEDYIAKTQSATGVLDDQLRPAFATLTRFTKNQTESQKLLNIALEISTATGKPLEAVSLALGKAYAGSTTALQKLGIQTKDAAGEALSFEQIQQNLIETFGGATQAAAETTAGKMKIAQAAFADLQEEVGVALIPALTGVLDAVKPLLDAFNSLSPEVQQVVVVSTMLAAIAKSASTALIGMGVAGSTAAMALGPLAAAMLLIQGINIRNAQYDKLNAEYNADYADSIKNITEASDEEIESLFALSKMHLRLLIDTGNLAEGTNLTETAFRDLAEASPATAQRLLDLNEAYIYQGSSADALNGILDETITSTINAGNAASASAAMIDEATAATDAFSASWDLLAQSLNTQVNWDKLDTSFDQLKTKAAEAFGGTEEQVKDFNEQLVTTFDQLEVIIEQLNLPPEVSTKIAVLYEQGELDKIWSLLNALDRAGITKRMAALGPGFGVGFFPGLANGGTVTSSGMAFVGENGPELLNLPAGATVTPLTSGGMGNTINITVTSADPQAVIDAIRNFERRNGNGWRR
jgi:hypothetical protein